MENELVSIIVPNYNGEEYIEKCLKKLLDQTYQNVEIVLVDDGSTDNSKEIIEKFEDKRIKKLYIEHNGVSNARNIGIKNAKGKYLMFLDADDLLERVAIQNLCQIMKEGDYDIIRFNGFIENTDSKSQPLENTVENGIVLDSTKVEEKKEVINLFCRPFNSLRGSSCLLFMKNENIIEFKTELTYLEDKLFCLENFLNNKKIKFINDRYYHYKFNHNSKTKDLKIFIDNMNEILKTKAYFLDIAKKHDYANSSEIDIGYLILVLYRFDFFIKNSSYNVTKNVIIQVLKLLEEYNITLSTTLVTNKIKKIQISLLKRKQYYLFYLLTKVKGKLK